MPTYYFFYLALLLILLFLGTRFFILKRHPLPFRLFAKGLQTENNGDFDEAIVIYENALFEVKKIRFHPILQMKIIEKLKLLNTVKKYKNDQHYIRKNDS